ncbi:MAG: HAD family hydrolase [Candidatus Helarchaeota archaeon]|nr:HAD family hydrolase [Candidatus Helarchaeota archaeon]
MKYNTIIFDLGFTLLTFKNFTLKRYFKTLDQGLDQLIQFLVDKKIIFDPTIFKKTFKKFRIRNFQRALTSYKESTTMDTLSQTFESLNLQKLSPKVAHQAIMLYHSTEGAFWKIRSSAKPVLQELRAKNFKIGLLSNAPYHSGIKFLMDSNNLTQYFDVIATSAQIGFCKPDKRTFEYVLNKIQSKPAHSIMVGDDLKNDIYGAQQIGMKAIYIKKNFEITPTEGLNTSPDKAITDLMEIIPIINEWNNS